MAEYIEREAAVQQCKRHDDYTAWSIKDGIEAIPAADVEEVVRCKDCKKSIKCSPGIICSRSNGLIGITENDFCSYGERR